LDLPPSGRDTSAAVGSIVRFIFFGDEVFIFKDFNGSANGGFGHIELIGQKSIPEPGLDLKSFKILFLRGYFYPGVILGRSLG